MSELIIIPALESRIGPGGGLLVTRKFISGMMEYCSRWPGKVTALMFPSRFPDTNLDHAEIHPGQTPFAAEMAPASSEALGQRLRGAVVLVSLTDGQVGLIDLCGSSGAKLVVISECTLRTRKQIIAAEVANPLRRWKRSRDQSRLERRFEDVVRRSAGIQCNGTPTFEAYRALSKRPILFFDTRVGREMLPSPQTLEERTAGLLAGRPLRLAFSGRLVAIKGVDHLPRVAAELRRHGVPFEMEICGSGDKDEQLRTEIRRLGLEGQVHLRGVLDFEKELVPLMRSSIDLFVCCHLQGDPSCTYLETLSCGVPIAGYPNEALRGVVAASGAGWVTHGESPAELAVVIADLHRDRRQIVAASRQALLFATENTFEKTMDRRVEHLIECEKAGGA